MASVPVGYVEVKSAGLDINDDIDFFHLKVPKGFDIALLKVITILLINVLIV